MSAVVVTGATGLVGRALLAALGVDGTPVRVISRDPTRAGAVLGAGVEAFGWDAGDLGRALGGAAAVVNLAGESLIGRRWSARQKARLRESRIDRTRDVVRAIGALPAAERPSVVVSASAVGYYGPSDDTELAEDAPAGADFLATLCADWEAAAAGVSAHGVRGVRLRIGVVLSAAGGALAAMRLPFKLFVGGPVLPGTQWMSWIHVDDLVQLIRFAIATPALQGAVNAVAPTPVQNREFSKAFGAALGRPSWLPVPGFALRWRFGEVASVLTTGQRVVPRAATDAGFTFAHTEVFAAMRAVHGR